MKPQKQLQDWRAERSELAVVITEGDIYAPLRKIRDKYNDRAEKIRMKHTDEVTGELVDLRGVGYVEIIESYRVAAGRINALIPEPLEEVAEVGGPGEGDVIDAIEPTPTVS